MRARVLAELTLCALLLALNGCRGTVSSGQPTITPGPTLIGGGKGLELYSWFAGDEWHFTLITGTNRLKTYREITAEGNTWGDNSPGWVKITVTGVDALKELLARVRRGEYVFWGTRVGGTIEGDQGTLALPDGETIHDIEEYCKQLGIKLAVIGSGSPSRAPTAASASSNTTIARSMAR